MTRYKILIIDDNLLNRNVVCEYLQDFDFRMLQAESGEKGIGMIREFHPDLVLLDLNMPIKNGFETLAEIQRTPDIANTPVIFLSSHGQAHLKVKGLEMGAEDYISRPFENAELLARIRVVLRHHPHCPSCEKEENKLQGNIEDMNLVELLQTIEMGKKKAEIVVPDLDIQIILENGRLVFCRFRDFKDQDALLRILLVESGHYLVRFHQIPHVVEKRDIKITQAIMTVTAYLDEANTMLTQLNPWKFIRINKKALSLKGSEIFGENMVVPLKHYVIALQGDIKENLKIILDLVRNKKILLLKERE